MSRKLPERTIANYQAEGASFGQVQKIKEFVVQTTIVRATCPRCGDVEMATHDLELRVCSAPEASTYLFTCPRCEKIVVKSASDERVVTLLTSVGVPTVRWDLPAELDEVHAGPPLTSDDLLDLHLLLDRPDWFERLQHVSARS